MDLLEAGKIVNTHGLRGEVKVVPWTDYPEDFEDIEYVIVKRKTGEEQLDIESVRYQKGSVLLKFKQIKDINEAEKYKNLTLYVPREMFDLPEGVHFIADLIGLDVINVETGDKIGVIADVFNTGSNDIYDVKREGKKNLLIPVIDDVVKEIDIENGKYVGYYREYDEDGKLIFEGQYADWIKNTN